MQRLTVFYFSPTEGTKRAAQLLAAKLALAETAIIDNTLPSQRKKAYEFTAEELVVIANPVYAGQLPPVQGLWQNLRGHGTPCVIMACYGNRHYDDTLAQMQKMLEAQGFIVAGAVAPVIPHIFAPSLGAGRPDAQDAAVLQEFAAAVLQKIASGKLASVKLPGNPAPAPTQAAAVPKTFLPDKCAACGMRANRSPADAIAADYSINEKRCINCMRCARICPAGARTFAAEKIKAYLESLCSTPRPLEYIV